MVTTQLEAVIRMHRKYHGNPTIARRVAMLRRLREEGLPGRPPSAAKRLQHIGLGMEWDGQAREGREAVVPYKDSPEELHHRLGDNLPTSKNGSNS